MSKKKILEMVCILVVLGAFILLGCCTYQSYQDKKENNASSTKVNNYYNIDYLFNNNYLKKPSTINEFNKEDKIYMYLDKNNTLYIKNKENRKLNKNISGLPNEDLTVYYNKLNDSYYELATITSKNELYYVYLNINSRKNYRFTKISSGIKDIYSLSYDNTNIYVNTKGLFKTNFILENENNNINYLTYNKGYELKSDISKQKPNFDYICAPFDLCKDIVLYQSFDNNLIYKNKELTIGTNDNKELVKEMFASFKVDSKKEIDLKKINYRTLIKKYKFTFTVYVITESDSLYKYEINNKGIKKLDFLSKIKQIDYNKTENSIKSVNIVYDDKKIEKIGNSLNEVIVVSTTYNKNSI